MHCKYASPPCGYAPSPPTSFSSSLSDSASSSASCCRWAIASNSHSCGCGTLCLYYSKALVRGTSKAQAAVAARIMGTP